MKRVVGGIGLGHKKKEAEQYQNIGQRSFLPSHRETEKSEVMYCLKTTLVCGS